jgi:hypothetical protein
MDGLTIARRLRFRWITTLALLTLASCGGSAGGGLNAPTADGWHTFEGNWTASGTRTTLDLGTNHTASNFHLNGTLVLTEGTLAVGFRAEIIGLVDSQSGMVGRAVWTDEQGDKVFSELKGQVETGNRIAGTFLGGSGRYAGAMGEYEFQWKYVLTPEDGTMSGRAVGLKGRLRGGAPSGSVPPVEGVR